MMIMMIIYMYNDNNDDDDVDDIEGTHRIIGSLYWSLHQCVLRLSVFLQFQKH